VLATIAINRERSKISGYDLKYYIAANRSSLKYLEGKEAI